MDRSCFRRFASRRAAVVRLEHAAQPLVADDFAVNRLRLGRREQFVGQSLVRALTKVIANVFANQVRQLALAEDEEPIQALGLID